MGNKKITIPIFITVLLRARKVRNVTFMKIIVYLAFGEYVWGIYRSHLLRSRNRQSQMRKTSRGSRRRPGSGEEPLQKSVSQR